MTPPVLGENSDQFVPNWNFHRNACHNPKSKLTAKILPQNREASTYFSSPVLIARVLSTTNNMASSMVSWGKR